MTAPPCAGLHELFDSTDFYDHRHARQLCAKCPMLTACEQLLTDTRRRASYITRGGGPRGTWVGQLIGGPFANADRIAAEEAMFTGEEARRAHAAWARTRVNVRRNLSDRISLGERVYQRRIKRGEHAA